MKFDYIIGNPPYQEESEGNNRAKPVYPFFIDASQKIADAVELIHPARFLFNAGQTSKAWNQKMLDDEHFKVLAFEPKGSNIFPNTDIKGGVAITYWDKSRNFGAIGEFIDNPMIRDILSKVKWNEESLNSIHFNRSSYRFTDTLYAENPTYLKNVKESERLSITSNVFDKFPKLFSNEKNDENTVGILGRDGNLRRIKYIKEDYIKNHPNLHKWKVFLAKSNGTGTYGETLSPPEIGQPDVVATQTFISFGAFNTEAEAINLIKYMKTKFLRALLSIKKVTPDNARKDVWKYVPLQDFTSHSDIDWNVAIPEIDQQLYHKYGLNHDEIEFIETHVKEMN